MKVFYLSNHGFGHMIRSIPMLETLSKQDTVYVACGKHQINFLKKYFSNRIERFIFKVVQTDVGFVTYKHSIKVHKEKTEKAVIQFMKQLPQLVNEEISFLKDKNITEVYADISPLGIIVGKNLKTKVYVLTNFTWYKQYLHLGLDKKIIDFYYEIDKMMDELWSYPLSFPFQYLHCLKRPIEFITRPIDQVKVQQLKNKYHSIISIFSGMSSQFKVEVENFTGLIITSDKIQIKSKGPIIVLGEETLDSQNYIASSDLVITKAGFTTISECISAKVKMVLIERPSAFEDTYLIETVKKLNLGTSISQTELKKIDIAKYLN